MNDFVKEVIISKINFETGFKYSNKRNSSSLQKWKYLSI